MKKIEGATVKTKRTDYLVYNFVKSPDAEWNKQGINPLSLTAAQCAKLYDEQNFVNDREQDIQLFTSLAEFEKDWNTNNDVIKSVNSIYRIFVNKLPMAKYK
jgi:hypothetical protein